jgi:hypothetical protein
MVCLCGGGVICAVCIGERAGWCVCVEVELYVLCVLVRGLDGVFVWRWSYMCCVYW